MVAHQWRTLLSVAVTSSGNTLDVFLIFRLFENYIIRVPSSTCISSYFNIKLENLLTLYTSNIKSKKNFFEFYFEFWWSRLFIMKNEIKKINLYIKADILGHNLSWFIRWFVSWYISWFFSAGSSFYRRSLRVEFYNF